MKISIGTTEFQMRDEQWNSGTVFRMRSVWHAPDRAVATVRSAVSHFMQMCYVSRLQFALFNFSIFIVWWTVDDLANTNNDVMRQRHEMNNNDLMCKRSISRMLFDRAQKTNDTSCTHSTSTVDEMLVCVWCVRAFGFVLRSSYFV